MLDPSPLRYSGLRFTRSNVLTHSFVPRGQGEGRTRSDCLGHGDPRREFLYVDDLADACLFLLKNYDANPPEALGQGGQPGEIVNVGTVEDLTILELAEHNPL
jgi:nucleoside-diphosphate-sugar epimerase